MVASADLLKVMSRSTFELQTVLDTVVNSRHACATPTPALIFRREDGHFRLAAEHGLNPEQKTFLGRTAGRANPQHHGWPCRVRAPHHPHSGRVRRRRIPVARGRQGRQLSLYPGRAAAARGRAGRRDHAHPQHARPFSAQQIELISTFANQTVIAIETVRLFEQVKERTAEIERTRSVLATMIDNMDDGLALMTPTADGDVRCDFVNQRMMEFQRYPADVVFPGLP
jgi:hypothetical protein